MAKKKNKTQAQSGTFKGKTKFRKNIGEKIYREEYAGKEPVSYYGGGIESVLPPQQEEGWRRGHEFMVNGASVKDVEKQAVLQKEFLVNRVFKELNNLIPTFVENEEIGKIEQKPHTISKSLKKEIQKEIKEFDGDSEVQDFLKGSKEDRQKTLEQLDKDRLNFVLNKAKYKELEDKRGRDGLSNQSEIDTMKDIESKYGIKGSYDFETIENKRRLLVSIGIDTDLSDEQYKSIKKVQNKHTKLLKKIKTKKAKQELAKKLTEEKVDLKNNHNLKEKIISLAGEICANSFSIKNKDVGLKNKRGDEASFKNKKDMVKEQIKKNLEVG